MEHGFALLQCLCVSIPRTFDHCNTERRTEQKQKKTENVNATWQERAPNKRAQISNENVIGGEGEEVEKITAFRKSTNGN